MPVIPKDQEVIEFEADLLQQLSHHTPHSITGNELIALVQELPVVVSNMTSPEDPQSTQIIKQIAQLLKNYPKNFEVHLPATFQAIYKLDTSTPELCSLVSAVAQQVNQMNRPFTDTESWTAIHALQNFCSNHSETLALVKAISNKLPVQNTKIEFTPVDDVLLALRGLNALDSDHPQVQDLLLAINFRLRFKKGKVKFFSSFQGEFDSVVVRSVCHHRINISVEV